MVRPTPRETTYGITILRGGPTARYPGLVSHAQKAPLRQPAARANRGEYCLKHELRRLRKTGQRSGRRVEHRTAAQLAFDAPIQHGFAARPASEHANQPA